MIYIDGKSINPRNVVYVGDVQEVKRAKPKVAGGDGELPPVYNFIVKAGSDSIKTQDFDSYESAKDFFDKIIVKVSISE